LREGVGGKGHSGLLDRKPYTFNTAQQITIADAEDTETVLLNPGVSDPIRQRVDMRDSIDLADHARNSTIKISAIRTQRHLSAEFQPRNAIAAQSLP
jgi:hypothetical protein